MFYKLLSLCNIKDIFKRFYQTMSDPEKQSLFRIEKIGNTLLITSPLKEPVKIYPNIIQYINIKSLQENVFATDLNFLSAI